MPAVKQNSKCRTKPRQWSRREAIEVMQSRRSSGLCTMKWREMESTRRPPQGEHPSNGSVYRRPIDNRSHQLPPPSDPPTMKLFPRGLHDRRAGTRSRTRSWYGRARGPPRRTSVAPAPRSTAARGHNWPNRRADVDGRIAGEWSWSLLYVTGTSGPHHDSWQRADSHLTTCDGFIASVQLLTCSVGMDYALPRLRTKFDERAFSHVELCETSRLVD